MDPDFEIERGMGGPRFACPRFALPLCVTEQSWRSTKLGNYYRHEGRISLGVKRVAVAPFELKLGPHKSYGRSASVKPPPGAKNAQIRAKIRVKLQGSAAWAQPL